MGLSSTLRTLALVVEGIEGADASVAKATLPDGASLAEAAASVTVTVNVALLKHIDPDMDVDVAPRGATIDDDGTLTAELAVTMPAPDGGSAAGDRPSSTAEATGRSSATASASENGDEDGDGDEERDAIPAYRDPERLEAVYGAHETFAEMTEALGVDVTPQTVRRHMIKHGVHDPASDAAAPARSDDEGGAEAADGEAESDGDGTDGSEADAVDGDEPVVEGDNGEADELRSVGDVDLPDGMAVDELRNVVLRSRTVHEVSQRMNVDRDRARRVLRDLNLLEVVSGRLAAADARDRSPEEIDRRIRRAAARNAAEG